MIVKCSYCNRCLNDTEYQILNRKVRTKQRAPTPKTYTAEDSDIAELRTMSGGEKHLWLRNHRDEILEYLEQNGDSETRRHYGIARLNILQDFEKWNIPYQKTMTKTEILESTINSLHDEIRILKSKIPQAISKLPAEDQVKLLTFQLSEAVSKLESKASSDELLNIRNLYSTNPDGTLSFTLK